MMEFPVKIVVSFLSKAFCFSFLNVYFCFLVTGVVAVTSFSDVSVDMVVAVTAALSTGTVTYVVSDAQRTLDELQTGIADGTLTCTGSDSMSATVAFNAACELNGGATYYVYAILSYDGLDTLVEPKSITIAGKS